MSEQTTKSWFSLTKVKDLVQLFLFLLMIFSIIYTLDIFFIKKESKLEHDEESYNTIIDLNVLEAALSKHDLGPDSVRVIGRVKVIDGTKYVFPSTLPLMQETFYSFPTAENATVPEELYEAMQRGVLDAFQLLETTENLTELLDRPGSNIAVIRITATPLFNPYPNHLAFSPRLDFNIIKDLETYVKENNGECYAVEILVKNNGNLASGIVEVTFPNEVKTAFAEEGRWNIEKEKRRASIDSVEVGQELSLLLIGEKEIEFKQSDIQLNNKESTSRVWAYWAPVVFTLLIVVSAVAYFDWKMNKQNTIHK